MKIFCLVITFLFLVGIFANDYAKYNDLVGLTTAGIRYTYFQPMSVEGRPGANATVSKLEYLIEKMVDDVNNNYKYQEFHEIEILLEVDEPPPRPIEKANQFLDIMLQQLEALLGLSGIYSIDFAPGATREDVKNIRRAYVVWSLRSAITRRILGAPDDAPILPKCRLLALYLSTQSPLAYIEEVNIDPTGHTCIFKDRHHFEKRYSKIGGSWSEVDGNGQFRETLETQLQRIQPQVPPTS